MTARYLLDTHVLLWWLADPDRLSPRAREAIQSGSNEVFVSAAAIWEMAIKRTLGRLDFPGNLDEVLRKERIRVLAITLPHALAVGELPLHHQDPFDRMQIAQARREGLDVVTRDRQFDAYEIDVLPA